MPKNKKVSKKIKPDNHHHYWKAIGLGAVAGIRSLAAPVLLSQEFRKIDPALLQGSPLRFLQAGPVARGLKVLAASELGADKLPQMPNRTTLPSLVVRTASGALVGAALFTANRDKAFTGALIGGLAAFASTYGSFYLRLALTRYGNVPNIISGLMEDAVMMSSGLAMVKK
jgi:uncharacterized membrane protein